NSTIAKNVALSASAPGLSNSSTGGGGVCLYTGSLSIENCTIAGNTAATSNGGGVWVKIAGNGTTKATLSVVNSILAGNTDRTGAEDLGRFTGTTNSVINVSNSLIQAVPLGGVINGVNTGNIVGQDPFLGLLENNGGPTQTMALQAGSPAIDAGAATLLTTD